MKIYIELLALSRTSLAYFFCVVYLTWIFKETKSIILKLQIEMVKKSVRVKILMYDTTSLELQITSLLCE